MIATSLATAGLAGGLLLSSTQAWSDEYQLTPIEELGKRLFFTNISDPPRQSCATCHEPAAGGTNGHSHTNLTQVAVTGANPHAPDPEKVKTNPNGKEVGGNLVNAGTRRPQTNMYVGFFVPEANPPFPCDSIDVVGDGKCGRPIFDIDALRGGNFWDGRATGEKVAFALGCETEDNSPSTPSDDIFYSCTDLHDDYLKYLGPIADQAFASPFFNPKEQGLADAVAVCKFVANKTKWGRDLYEKVFYEALECPDDDSEIQIPFGHFAVALAAYQMSWDNNRFDAWRDLALADDWDKKFPLEGFSDEENLGHDIFYGTNDSGLNRDVPTAVFSRGTVNRPLNAGCAKCHANEPQGIFFPAAPQPVGDDGSEPFQTYSDHGFHNLGLWTNPEIVTQSEPDLGVVEADGVQCGRFATTTLRNLTQKPNKNFVKAYMHNGIFKDLWQVIHFYNTANTNRIPCPVGPFETEDGPTGFGCVLIVGPGGGIRPKLHDVTRCDDREEGWTAEEAIAANCWPAPEVRQCTNGNNAPIGTAINLFGNIGLTFEEEKALVAYLETLDDTSTTEPPKPYQAPGQKKKKGKKK